MGEVAYAKQFLAILDTKPVKYTADHVFDQRKLSVQAAYTLPRMPQAYEKPGSKTATTGGTVTLKLKPLSASAEAVTLNDISPSASVYEIKAQVAKQTGYTPDKVKVLWERRPVGDAKTLSEIKGDINAGETIDMGIMFVGKPTQAAGDSSLSSPPGSEAVPVVEKSTGRAALDTAEFWEDLKGFVVQRTKDQELGEQLVGIFREAWKDKGASAR